MIDNGKLDAWITGHWGHDHPDNAAPETQRCAFCEETFDTQDMSGDACQGCIDSGWRVCRWCGDHFRTNGGARDTCCKSCSDAIREDIRRARGRGE